MVNMAIVAEYSKQGATSSPKRGIATRINSTSSTQHLCNVQANAYTVLILKDLRIFQVDDNWGGVTLLKPSAGIIVSIMHREVKQ